MTKNKIFALPYWAKSAKNNDIALYSHHNIESLIGTEPILFIGGVHGDEPEGVRLAQDWLTWLTETEQPLKTWALITCINPDGYKSGSRMNGNNVDLNRNFPSACWEPNHSKPRYFPGKFAGSEPEISALVQLINTIKPQLIIHFHSWEPSIVYSNEKANWAAEHLSESSGYLKQADIGYPTPGSLGEYAGNDLDIGVICIEEKEGEPLDKVFAKFKQGLINIIKT